jgi:hypothetical protein
MSNTNRKLRVFLCYAKEDKPIVRELYWHLANEDWIDPWLDDKKLLPGQDWEMKIENAVESADAVIVCLSKKAIGKVGYVQKEIKKVLEASAKIPEDIAFLIPLRLEECEVPKSLLKWQWGDYFPVEKRNITYGKVIESLQNRAEPLNIHIPLRKDTAVEDEIRKIKSISKSRKENGVFVVMPFALNYDSIYRYIQEVAVTMGKVCQRVGQNLTYGANADIVSDIYHSLQNTELVIAELSGSNPNVYFEIGLSHAWQKNVVLIANRSEIKNIPEILSEDRIIFYESKWGSEKTLMNELQDRLSAEFLMEDTSKHVFPNIDPSLCFAITSPKDGGLDTYETIIKKSIEEVGLNSIYLWDKTSWYRQGAETGYRTSIKETLSKAYYVVADLSWNDPTAFYLAGLAYGLKKNFKFLYQHDKEPPFDIRHLNLLRYSNVREVEREDARNKLREVLQSVLKRRD